MNWFAKNWSSVLYLAVMTTIMIFSIVFMKDAEKSQAMSIGVPVVFAGSILLILFRVKTLLTRSSK